MPYTVRNLITETMQDITAIAVGDTFNDTDATAVLRKLTRLFDNLNAEQAGVYGSSPNTYTLVANLNPHTIGPATFTPNFVVTQRPVSIDDANLVVTMGTSAFHYPLKLVNQEWYASLSLPSLATWPFALWYSTDWPVGRIFLFPVPDQAFQLQLWTRTVLADLTLDDAISFPPGYRDMIILTLGEMVAPSYPPAVADAVGAAKARARVFANNDPSPTLATADSGLPNGAPGAGWTILNTLRGY